MQPNNCSVEPTISKDPIRDFLSLMAEGLSKWVEAGKVLVNLREMNPSIYREILQREPMLTIDVLMTFERIGRGEVYPKLLLNPRMSTERILGYPYKEQVRLCDEAIDVVVKSTPGKWVVTKKMAAELSKSEIMRVLGLTGVNSVEYQKAALAEEHPVMERGLVQGNGAKTSPPRSAAVAGIPMTTPNKALPATPPQLIAIGRWAVRQGIGNNCGFERTMATPDVRIILEDGIAVIEVCRKK